jgi:hypothetical protein
MLNDRELFVELARDAIESGRTLEQTLDDLPAVVYSAYEYAAVAGAAAVYLTPPDWRGAVFALHAPGSPAPHELVAFRRAVISGDPALEPLDEHAARAALARILDAALSFRGTTEFGVLEGFSVDASASVG